MQGSAPKSTAPKKASTRSWEVGKQRKTISPGETPCAFVTLKPGQEKTDPADIIAFCRDIMARFKVPKTIVYGDLPKTVTGKIRKFALRDRANGLADGEAAYDANKR